MGSCCTLQGTFFKEKCKKWKVCLDCIYVDGLHMSPSPRALSAPQKLRKKATRVKYTLVCIKNTKKYEKIPPKGTQMGGFILVLAPLGAPLAPQFVFWDEKCIQKAPKVTPRCLNWAQKWCQSAKSASKFVKIYTLSNCIWKLHYSLAEFSKCYDYVPGPADCAKRFQ